MPQPISKFKVRSPSNIAFVKYWGKYGRQYPMNPSLSMTLSHCYTEYNFEYHFDTKAPGIHSFLFDGMANENFKRRLDKFLENCSDVYPLAKSLVLKLESKNTFPHSAGIASSASAMSAFCLGLGHIESLYKNEKLDLKRASFLSRLASGSACRSLFPSFSLWGETKMGLGHNDYAIAYENFHPSFASLQDAVIIVSAQEKSVSSSAGHQLMNAHCFKEARIDQAHENLRTLIGAMESGDMEAFGEIIEQEALTLHALMMTSTPSYLLLAPNSLEVIQRVRSFRKETGLPVYFTIDAGPNIHLIYPLEVKEHVDKFLTSLDDICENIIYDEIGQGAEVL
ncbi:MAG: diphosphomevalonate decarboxylase [Bacteriovoracaceae bacterium]|jgi:diphosphomevalonate decarboxylase|nr:diphosphomevalonate decarboxylase [Halobacteriovoraceae bacterium]MDP7321405.1 diphosphomevalonate decarboxylase [Bacteriovoracaceae bacterium]